MAFELRPGGIYQSTLLGQLKWLEHGFGTRSSDGWPGEYTFVKQIHSDRVVVADRAGCLGSGDALATDVPGRWIGIRTADCVPILLADPKRRAVAAVHAGWRGTLADIAGAAVRALAEGFGSLPADLAVAIGPSIGVCCFEVGPEVGQRFQALFPQEEDLRKIDLVEANRRQLVRAGVKLEQIDCSRLCTMCLADRFHSYRRDRERAGRMVSAIRVR